jgi:hypothetical protein
MSRGYRHDSGIFPRSLRAQLNELLVSSPIPVSKFKYSINCARSRGLSHPVVFFVLWCDDEVDLFSLGGYCKATRVKIEKTHAKQTRKQTKGTKTEGKKKSSKDRWRKEEGKKYVEANFPRRPNSCRVSSCPTDLYLIPMRNPAMMSL